MTVDYWNRRYRRGGRSGERRLSDEALTDRYRHRADFIHRYAGDAESVLDIGCGDGIQASWLKLPAYLGVDSSPEAVRVARTRNPDKAFAVLADPDPRDLHLSLSVIFHLVDEQAYRKHLALLFSARRYVIVDASDRDEPGASHVRHRHWTSDVPDGWELVVGQQRMTVWKRA